MFSTLRQISLAAWAAFAGMLLFSISPAHAQGAPGVHQDNSGINGSLSKADLEKLGGDHKQDTSSDVPKDPVLARAKAKSQSLPLLQALQISCDVSDAKLVVAGTRRPTAGGKEQETRVYEVACAGNMGYLLETVGKETPIAISCLSAEEARAADVAKSKEPSFFCKLTENTNVYAMVTGMIMKGVGAQCDVGTLQLYGRSESTHSEYSEVACKDGNGFLLRITQPGFRSENAVMSCAEAAKQSIKCRLTDPGPVEVPVMLQTLKEALARNGVACDIGQIRLIGQEDHLKRYVVEYMCANQATSAIAFVPLAGNSNPYESLDCAAALSRRDVACTFRSQ
jgi:hypothetical protein